MSAFENEVANLSFHHSSGNSSYTCDECARSFQRREHLDRHRLSHSKQRPFQCQMCNKSFTRRDTLRRHTILHGQIPASKAKSSSRAVQACTSCMQSKKRCSGNLPCDRCTRRGWRCMFPQGFLEQRPRSTPSPCFAKDAGQNQLDTRSGSEAELSAQTHSNEELALNPTDTLSPTALGSNSTIGQQDASSSSLNWDLTSNIRDDLSFLFDPMLLWPLADSDDNSFGFQPFVQPSSEPLIEAPGSFTSINHFQSRDSTLAKKAQETTLQAGINAARNLPQTDDQNHLPGMSTADYEILLLEDNCHVPPISSSVYERLCELCEQLSTSSSVQLRFSLPELEILNAFAQLYFEHFHKGFPIVHQATFEVPSDSLLLILAVAAIGSQYSRLSTRSTHAASLLRILRHAFLSKLSMGGSLLGDLQLAQAILLFNYSLIFGGKRDDIIHAQYQRNILTTICRPFLIPGILFEKERESAPGAATCDWMRWIRIESWKRVIYFSWVAECIQWVIFDLPPLLHVRDLCIDLPCDDDLWTCADLNEWGRLLGLQSHTRRSLSVVELLRKDDLEEVLESLGSSAQLVTLCTIYTEERAMMQQFGSYSHDPLIDTSTEGIGMGPQASAHPFCVLGNRYDKFLDIFPKVHRNHQGMSHIGVIIQKVHHVFQITRFVPYRLMYSSCGWLIHAKEANAFAQKMAQRFEQEPERARRILIHAAQLFHLIRSQQIPDGFDCFLLLIAALYIWFYDRFIVAQGSGPLAGPVHLNTLRIDQKVNPKSLDAWVNGGDELKKLIHISGVGFLNGRDSNSRILREAIRVLSHDGAWSVQSNALARSLQSMLTGRLPSFND